MGEAAKTGDWQNGICGCFGDLKVCAFSYFLPCYVQGKNAEAVGDDCVKCALVMFCPIANLYFRAKTREKIRESKGIEGTCMKDCVMAWLCPLCTLAQEAREVGSLTMERA